MPHQENPTIFLKSIYEIANPCVSSGDNMYSVDSPQQENLAYIYKELRPLIVNRLRRTKNLPSTEEDLNLIKTYSLIFTHTYGLNYPEQKLAFKFLQQVALPFFEKEANQESENLELLGICLFDAFTVCVGRKEISENFVTFMDNHPKLLQAGLENPDTAKWFYHYLTSRLDYPMENWQEEELPQDKILSIAFGQNPKVSIEDCLGICPEADYQYLCLAPYQRTLESIGYYPEEAKDIISTWGQTLNPLDRYSVSYRKNLLNLIALEQRSPGLCLQLYRRHKLSLWSKYPIHDLQEQYSNRPRPYFLVATSQYDHNTAFSAGLEREVYEQLSEHLHHLGHGLRFIEFNNPEDLSANINNALHDFGQADCLILDAHTSKDFLVLDLAPDDPDSISASTHQPYPHLVQAINQLLGHNGFLTIRGCEGAKFIENFRHANPDLKCHAVGSDFDHIILRGMKVCRRQDVFYALPKSEAYDFDKDTLIGPAPAFNLPSLR